MKTESQLQRDVLEEFKWEPSVHAAEIGVEVMDGVVTLSGVVHTMLKSGVPRGPHSPSPASALAIAMKLKGSGPRGRTDADIARAAERVIGWSTSVPESVIRLMVENGFITLRGSVDRQCQRLAAVDSVLQSWAEREAAVTSGWGARRAACPQPHSAEVSMLLARASTVPNLRHSIATVEVRQ